MMIENAVPRSIQSFAVAVDRAVLAFSRHWLLVLTVPLTVFVGLPWLAPVLMAWGYELPARAIYFAYSFVCHQLPQRSYFLFGPKVTYSLAEISAVWEWRDLAELRRFIGTPEMGYKVAFAHRLTAIYLAVFVGHLFFALVRRRMAEHLEEVKVDDRFLFGSVYVALGRRPAAASGKQQERV